MHGFQIWLNLPAAEKMKPAAYQEIASASVGEQLLPKGGEVRVIAGDVRIDDVVQQGQIVNASTQPVFLDTKLLAGESVKLDFDSSQLAQVYVYKGNTDSLMTRELGVYAEGDSLVLTAGPSGVELLVLSGQKINEPIVQYGPFVMNTAAQIDQAIKDFQSPHFLENLKRA